MSIALNAWLKPLLPYLLNPNISEICINKPEEVWIEQQGHFVRHDAPELNEDRLRQLAELLAENNHKPLSETRPLLSATLPTGERCQFVLPPACEKGQLVCSIRKPAIAQLTLTDWARLGAFTQVGADRILKQNALKTQLRTLAEKAQWQKLIEYAIQAKLNIVISGGTSSAKTTFLNACLQQLPLHERLITVEGVREVQTNLPNCVHLLANEDEDSELSVSMLDLLKVCFRLRPDRIFLSELRSREAYPFLRACISGHPGSLTTLHADSVESAIEQLCFMLAEANELRQAGEVRLKKLIHHAVDIIVQMKRNADGTRCVDDIYLMEKSL